MFIVCNLKQQAKWYIMNCGWIYFSTSGVSTSMSFVYCYIEEYYPIIALPCCIFHERWVNPECSAPAPSYQCRCFFQEEQLREGFSMLTKASAGCQAVLTYLRPHWLKPSRVIKRGNGKYLENGGFHERIVFDLLPCQIRLLEGILNNSDTKSISADRCVRNP